jgi:hypothetical protein
MTTLFSPKKLSELSSDILNFRGTGITGTATAGTSTNIDYQLPEDRLVLGAYAILSNHVLGDSMTVQVVDKDGLYYPAGTVLNQFTSSWYVASDTQTQRGMEAPYPAKILAGLYLRCIYTSTGLLNVACYFNVLFHKVLA